MTESFACPVCGFPGLTDPPRQPQCGGSYEICPSCGFQFGYTDEDEGFSDEAWRTDWVARGMPWSSVGMARPVDWNPEAQLRARLS